MAYFTFEDACTLEPSQILDMFLSRTVFSERLWRGCISAVALSQGTPPYLPHHKEFNRVFLQCFTAIFHTSLHNGRKIKPKKRANNRPTRRGQVTAYGADRKTLIWKLLFSILFYEHLAKYYVVPDLRKTRWLPRNILIFEDMLLEYLEVGSEVETAHLRWNN